MNPIPGLRSSCCFECFEHWKRPAAIKMGIEQGRRRIAAAKRPVIADIGPDPADHGLHFRQHRDLGVVGMDPLRAHHVDPDRVNQRRERHHAGADPVRQRRDIDLSPASLLHELLPWEWKRLRQADELADQQAA